MSSNNYNEDADQEIILEIAIQESIETKLKQDEEKRILHSRNKADIQRVLLESIETFQSHQMQHAMNDYAIEYTIQRTETKVQGSWDCPICTLINEPYTQKCNTCYTPAPSHVLTFHPFPSEIRFGLEIEIVIPYGLRDGFTHQSIAKSISNMISEQVRFMGYTHVTSSHWKIVTDASIQPNHGTHDTCLDLCFELVSPILIGDGSQGLQQLRNIMGAISTLGISSNTSCGFHIHIDAEPNSTCSSLNALKAICQSFVAVENAFDVLVSDERLDTQGTRRTNRNKYCQSNRLVFGPMSNRQRWKKIENVSSRIELVNIMNPNLDRYRKLNLTNIIKRNRPSTIEFRHHGGVEDLQEAEVWVRFILRFCRNAVQKKEDCICLLSEHSTVQDELRALFDLVGCPGLEQFYSMNRKLFLGRDRIHNEWTCAVCQGSFGNSRALSQHCSATNHFS